ncbi:GNS1/SUR4 family domain-containing protein [Ditylenchus destructor]|nr:GNS1/SUR4 family domain-containing protein [Ditylenchus destructor]
MDPAVGRQHSEGSSQGYASFRTHDGTPIYHIPYKYDHFFESPIWNPTFVHSMFERYWHYSFAIVAVYVAGIYSLQKWMINRKPYNLKTALILWNTGLALFSAVGFWRLSEEFFFVLSRRSFQDSVCLSIDPTQAAAFWALCFALSKVAELFDTVFLVLRKRPLIFLHWYHHAIVLCYSWAAACKLTAAARYFITMNYGVHAIMYTYYAITSTGFRLPRRLSMLVTTLQTTQMLIGVGVTIYVASLKLRHGPELICQQTNENLIFCFSIYFTFAILFARFFINAYLTPKHKQAASHRVENGVGDKKSD